jgi:hypothetical protein
MKAKLETEDGRKRYAKRKQSVEPAFGIIKSAIGFARFHLRGLANVASEWTLVTLAYTAGGSTASCPLDPQGRYPSISSINGANPTGC